MDNKIFRSVRICDCLLYDYFELQHTRVGLLYAPTKLVGLLPTTTPLVRLFRLQHDCMTTSTTSSATSRRSLARLHCVHLPATTKFGYFEPDQPSSMSIPVGDGASNASSRGPVSGYCSILLWFIFCLVFLFNRRLNLNTCTYNMVTR
jgi:hypothetical protein